MITNGSSENHSLIQFKIDQVYIAHFYRRGDRFNQFTRMSSKCDSLRKLDFQNVINDFMNIHSRHLILFTLPT